MILHPHILFQKYSLPHLEPPGVQLSLVSVRSEVSPVWKLVLLPEDPCRPNTGVAHDHGEGLACEKRKLYFKKLSGKPRGILDRVFLKKVTGLRLSQRAYFLRHPFYILFFRRKKRKERERKCPKKCILIKKVRGNEW